MRRPAINTQECRAAAGGGGTCLPVGSSILVEEDTLLAGVESAVAKLTCWAAPIILPTDNGEVDIAPLLGAKGRDAASTDAYRSLLTHIYHGNEHRLYLSKNFCGCDDDSISALQEVICSRARDSRIDLKTKKRFPTYKDRNYPYILCQCKHKSGTDGPKSAVGAPLDPRAAYCKAIRDGLAVKDKQKVLLSLVFIKKEDKELAARFPENLYADVTMQTNSEARPMFTLCGKDSNNKTFTVLRGFLPYFLLLTVAGLLRGERRRRIMSKADARSERRMRTLAACGARRMPKNADRQDRNTQRAEERRKVMVMRNGRQACLSPVNWLSLRRYIM